MIRLDEAKVALGGSVKKRLEAKSGPTTVTCLCSYAAKNLIFLGTS